MKLFWVIVCFCFFYPVFSQKKATTLLSENALKINKRQSILGGLNFYPKENKSEISPKYSFEIGISSTKFRYTHHGSGVGWYGSIEWYLIEKNIIAPKVGAFFMAWLPLFIGGELKYETSFEQGSFIFIPYFGTGNQRLQVLLKPNIPITNRNFLDRNLISLTFYYHFLRLKKSK